MSKLEKLIQALKTLTINGRRTRGAGTLAASIREYLGVPWRYVAGKAGVGSVYYWTKNDSGNTASLAQLVSFADHLVSRAPGCIQSGINGSPSDAALAQSPANSRKDSAPGRRFNPFHNATIHGRHQ